MQVLFLFSKAKQFSTIHNEYKAAKSALQFSLLDLIGTIQNKSVSQIICGKQDYIQENVNYSFYTISHEQDLQSMLQNGKESLKFTNCIKIKFNNQINKLIELLIMMDQEQIGSKWIIDANASWTPNDYLQFQSMLLQHCGQNHSILHKLLFIQQPFPIFKSLNSLKTAQQIQTEQNSWQQIKQNTSMTIIADESFASFDDLESVLKYSHGINIKMEKCGGPLEAIKTLKQAQKRQIQHVMFGSMVSTHLGCSQTFQFYQFAQYFDIDGALLVKYPEINGGFEWKGSSGIIKVNGKGLALDKGDIEKLF